MDIIFVTKKGLKRRHWHFANLWHYCLLAGIILVSATLLAGLGYWFGLKQQPISYYAIAWRQEISEQKQEINELKLSSTTKIQALTDYIGQMQSHLTRLNALGGKLVKMADLDTSEFDFTVQPALGGPGKEQTETVSVLEENMQDLARQLASREYQLLVLENILQSKLLQQEVRPAGQPVKKGWVSSYFGYRNNPFGSGLEFHQGIDIAGSKGAEIIAVAGGVVTWAGEHYSYGKLVEIDHGSKGYVTRYAHCAKILVAEGTVVKKGQVIALMGSTGRSTGPHVHFEVLQGNEFVNPLDFIYAQQQ